MSVIASSYSQASSASFSGRSSPAFPDSASDNGLLLPDTSQSLPTPAPSEDQGSRTPQLGATSTDFLPSTPSSSKHSLSRSSSTLSGISTTAIKDGVTGHVVKRSNAGHGINRLGGLQQQMFQLNVGQAPSSSRSNIGGHRNTNNNNAHSSRTYSHSKSSSVSSHSDKHAWVASDVTSFVTESPQDASIDSRSVDDETEDEGKYSESESQGDDDMRYSDSGALEPSLPEQVEPLMRRPNTSGTKDYGATSEEPGGLTRQSSSNATTPRNMASRSNGPDEHRRDIVLNYVYENSRSEADPDEAFAVPRTHTGSPTMPPQSPFVQASSCGHQGGSLTSYDIGEATTYDEGCLTPTSKQKMSLTMEDSLRRHNLPKGEDLWSSASTSGETDLTQDSGTS